MIVRYGEQRPALPVEPEQASPASWLDAGQEALQQQQDKTREQEYRQRLAREVFAASEVCRSQLVLPQSQVPGARRTGWTGRPGGGALPCMRWRRRQGRCGCWGRLKQGPL